MTQQAAVLTKQGVVALLNALTQGQSLVINRAVISDVVLACTGDETSLPNNVFQMVAPQLLIYSPGPNVMRFALPMDATIGNFSIGTVGLYTSAGLLIALAAFPNAGAKTANALPSTLGNIRTLYVDIGYSDVSATINPLSSITPPNTNPITAALIYG